MSEVMGIGRWFNVWGMGVFYAVSRWPFLRARASCWMSKIIVNCRYHLGLISTLWIQLHNLYKCIWYATSSEMHFLSKKHYFIFFLLQRNVTSDKYKSHQHNKQKALTLMANVRHSGWHLISFLVSSKIKSTTIHLSSFYRESTFPNEELLA